MTAGALGPALDPPVEVTGGQDQAEMPPDAPAAPRRHGRQRVVGRAITYVVAAIMALFILVPIYLIFISAITPPDNAFDYPKQLIPADVSLETILFFINASGVQEAFWRSVVVALITLALSLVIGAPAGYAIARYVFRGRDTYRLTVLSTRAFPIVILAIPLAVTYLRFGLFDTVWGVAFMHTALALPFTVLITSSVFASVPRDLEEAAQTLGCTPLRAFLSVSLPLALPGLAAAAIFTWVISWNDVFAAVILTLRNPTLPAKILTALTQSPIYYQFAAGFVMLLPSLIVIFFIRRYLLGLWGRVVK
jgi:multiple sugar transport system permease protein